MTHPTLGKAISKISLFFSSQTYGTTDRVLSGLKSGAESSSHGQGPASKGRRCRFEEMRVVGDDAVLLSTRGGSKKGGYGCHQVHTDHSDFSKVRMPLVFLLGNMLW